MLEKEGLARIVVGELGLQDAPADLAQWRALAEKTRAAQQTLRSKITATTLRLKRANLRA